MLETLLALADDAATVRAAAGTVDLVFSGYDDAPRELFIIPDVRAFVAKLDAAFPYWLHFLSKIDASLFVVMACLLPIDTTTMDGGDASAYFPSGSLSVLLFKLFGAMNGLYAAHGLTANEAVK